MLMMCNLFTPENSQWPIPSFELEELKCIFWGESVKSECIDRLNVFRHLSIDVGQSGFSKLKGQLLLTDETSRL